MGRGRGDGMMAGGEGGAAECGPCLMSTLGKEDTVRGFARGSRRGAENDVQLLT